MFCTRWNNRGIDEQRMRSFLGRFAPPIEADVEGVLEDFMQVPFGVPSVARELGKNRRGTLEISVSERFAPLTRRSISAFEAHLVPAWLSLGIGDWVFGPVALGNSGENFF